MDCTTNAICEFLFNRGFAAELASFISVLLSVVVVSTVPLLIVILLIWGERKFAARLQDRVGPNRVGTFGLMQTFADLVKLLIKEDITPAAADKVLYNVAPLLSFASVVMIWAVVPFTPQHFGVDLDLGALYFVSIASLGTLAIMMAAWASNNKYALLGAFRVVALLVSYEVPLVFALLIPVLFAGSGSILDIVYAQSGMWFFFMAPLGAIIFFISAQAETGRAPFDLIEAESELVAGFNIEYSGMKFGMFFAAEFLHVFTNAVLLTLLYFGGWFFPLYDIPLIGAFWLLVKSLVLYVISLWIRNTVPRLRIDQVMDFNWKFLVPLSIVNLLVLAFLLKVMQELGIAVDLNRDTSFIDTLPMTVVMLIANALMIFGVINLVRNRGREDRLQVTADDEESLLTATAVGD